MLIDIHKHFSYQNFPEFTKTYGFGLIHLPARKLLKLMDKEGVDKAVVLPLVNPENMDIYGVAGNQECIQACRRYPDRLIPFCNVDPRALMNNPKANLSPLLKQFKDLGCEGIGEVCANLKITDPLCKNLYHHAGEQKMPVLFHLSARLGGIYGLVDKLGLPGLETVLKEFPDTVFIGHGPTFWAEFAAGVKAKELNSYPKGPVEKPGTLWRLLEIHPNLYGDMSANSCLNALSRNPEMGHTFLEKFNDKLFFGTDTFHSFKKPIPKIIPFLQDAAQERKISRKAYNNITHRNFQKMFQN